MNGFFMESTALIGEETKQHGYYTLSTENSFVEFLPVDDENNQNAVLAHHTEPNKDYQLLITTYSGLYRYQLNDVVRVKSVENGVPVFSYEYDMKQTITVGGIHLTEKMIGDCIISMRSKLSLPVTDYAYMENENENGIVIMLEIQNDDVSGIDTQKLAEEFEHKLENNNPEYHDAVSTGKVVKPEIVLIEQETQLLYRDVLMFRLKFPPDFIKPVRYINSPTKDAVFSNQE